MKATVELSDQEMSEILELTSARKKGPAVPRLMTSGEWGVELETLRPELRVPRRWRLNSTRCRRRPRQRICGGRR
jgi:hypothetical protein